MTPETPDAIWEQIAKILFSPRRMEDEGLFTYGVMQKIRRLDNVRNDKTWHQFLRWAIPALGVGVASLVLVTRTPSFFYEDPINVATEDWR